MMCQCSSLQPLLINEVPLVEPGTYEVINGDNKITDFDPARLSFDVPEEDGPFPGVRYMANYTDLDQSGAEVKLPVVTFFYKKLDKTTGKPEVQRRVIVLRGLGYGVHHDHKGQDPAFYMIGAEIGKFDPATGTMSHEETKPTSLQAKNYSMECLANGPYNPVVPAHPPKQESNDVTSTYEGSKTLRIQVDEFYKLLQTRLSGVPEVESALGLAASDPEHAFEIYYEYIALIKRMSELDDGELSQVQQAWHKLMSTHGEVGSASKKNAADILTRLSTDGNKTLTDAAIESVNPESEYFIAAINELANRMEGGHQLKAENRTPIDGDPASDKVIWGHTQITDPDALLHFTICHYLERYFSRVLAARGIEFAASEKDFFLNAMTDVILLDHVGPKAFNSIFEKWQHPRKQGGLGWLKQDRIEAYKLASNN